MHVDVYSNKRFLILTMISNLQISQGSQDQNPGVSPELLQPDHCKPMTVGPLYIHSVWLHLSSCVVSDTEPLNIFPGAEEDGYEPSVISQVRPYQLIHNQQHQFEE